jgi:hypothetical protein
VSAGSDPELQGEVAACGVEMGGSMDNEKPSRSELFVAALFLANGVLGTGIAMTSGGEFNAWYGGYMLMGGFYIIESWRLRRKLAQIESEKAELRGDTEAAATR